MGLTRPPSGAAFKADEHSASLGVGSRHNFLILERTSLFNFSNSLLYGSKS